MPLLVFFDGLNSSAWYCALVRTGWIQLSNKYQFLVVFGQGQGTFYESGPQRNKYGHLSFGDLYWQVEQPKEDLTHVDSLLDYMKRSYEAARCPVKIDIVEDRAHSYCADREEHLWLEFFLKHRRAMPSRGT